MEEIAAVQAKQEKKVKEDALVLHARIQAKKETQAAEKARLLAEEKRIRFEQAQQKGSAAAVELTKFESIRGGLERSLLDTQRVVKLEEEIVQDTAFRKRASVLAAVKNAQEERDKYLEAYDLKVRTAKELDRSDKEAILAKKREHAKNNTLHRQSQVHTLRSFGAKDRMTTVGQITANVASEVAALPE